MYTNFWHTLSILPFFILKLKAILSLAGKLQYIYLNNLMQVMQITVDTYLNNLMHVMQITAHLSNNNNNNNIFLIYK